MKYWLFSDFDGTLRNGEDGWIDPKDQKFVEDFIKNGNRFVIATGRSYTMIKYELRNTGLKPDVFITNAGGVITNGNGDQLLAITIDHQQLIKVVDYLSKMDLKSLIYVTPKDEHYLFTNKPSRYPDGSFKRDTVNKDFDYLLTQEIVCFKVQESREKLDMLIEFLNKEVPELTVINNTDSLLVEIHAPKSSKGHAIKLIQAMFHIREKQIITAGDDDNDITMLQWFTHSFAVKQEYNQSILEHGKNVVDNIFEIEDYLKKIRK